MSSTLQKFFTEQAANGGLALYRAKPILQIEVPGVVGVVNKRSDANGDYFAVTLLANGENSDYPKGTELKDATVRHNPDALLWSLADNNLTLGRGKEILGFAAYETNLENVDQYARLTRRIPYPDHKILALSVAFMEGGRINYMCGPKIGIPLSVRESREWQLADNSPRQRIEAGL